MSSVESINGRLYLKYYDPHKGYSRRKSLKLKDNQANRRSAQKIAKTYGTNFLPASFIDADKKYILFSDALKEFLQIKPFAKSTKEIYIKAGNYFLKASSDKFVNEYSARDYIRLLSVFNQLGHSQNTRSIYTRTLHSLWNYFIKIKLTEENIIEIIPPRVSVIRSIEPGVIQKILGALEKNKLHHAFVYFLVNTGVRVSTLVELKWEDIDWKRKLIILRNVKVMGTPFTIPLVPKFRDLLKQIGVKKSGKVFPYKDIWSTKFFNKAQKKLKLKTTYGIHRLKHTFISESIKQGVPIEILSELTNTSLRTLKRHYANISKEHLSRELQRIKIG